MTYILIRFTYNVADEYDVKGFIILNKSRWEEYLNRLRNVKYPVGWMKGNAYVIFNSFEDVERTLTATKISGKEYKAITSRPGTQSFSDWHCDLILEMGGEQIPL